MTRWVSRLIAANIVVFLLTSAQPHLGNLLAFSAADFMTRPWSAFTYMFVHGGLWHIAFNMLTLYFFGPRVEQRLGSAHFLSLYLVSGLGGAALSFLTPHDDIVGASGAVFGVLMAFAHYWPRERIMIWGVIPVEARVMVLLTTGYALLGGISHGAIGNGIAHYAHLGGYGAAFLYLAWLDRYSPAREFRKRVDTALYGGQTGGVTRVLSGPPEPRWDAIPREGLHPLNLEELDRLEEKVQEHGMASLTADERAFLHRLSLRESAPR